jgi:hypothetical protein
MSERRERKAVFFAKLRAKRGGGYTDSHAVVAIGGAWCNAMHGGTLCEQCEGCKVDCRGAMGTIHVRLLGVCPCDGGCWAKHSQP